MSDYLEQLKKEVQSYVEKNKKDGKKFNRDEMLAKYFVPRSTKELWRFLPPKQGHKHIEEAFFHEVTLNGPGGKKLHGKKIYCPAHNDPKVPKLDDAGNPILDQEGKPVLVPAPCPFCDEYKRQLSAQDNSIKGIKKENMTQAQLKVLEENTKIFKEAAKWKARRFFIAKGIDKGKEKDGVKFWRFKENYKNNGVMDKLAPLMGEYIDVYGVDFADPEKGSNLSITMAENEFNGRTYMAVSALSFRPPSKLHEDPIVMKQWLNDDTTWRDVFLPKKAPNITPYQYMAMAVKGQDPYWDDTDPNNKRWVFPGHPELEEMANTRNRDLSNSSTDENFQQASDLSYGSPVVSTTVDTSTGTDVTAEFKETDKSNPPMSTTPPTDVDKTEATIPQTTVENEVDDDYDDLPF